MNYHSQDATMDDFFERLDREAVFLRQYGGGVEHCRPDFSRAVLPIIVVDPVELEIHRVPEEAIAYVVRGDGNGVVKIWGKPEEREAVSRYTSILSPEGIPVFATNDLFTQAYRQRRRKG